MDEIKLKTKVDFEFDIDIDIPVFNVDMKINKTKKQESKIIEHKRKKKTIDVSTKLF